MAKRSRPSRVSKALRIYKEQKINSKRKEESPAATTS